jgi:hypothetical protein
MMEFKKCKLALYKAVLEDATRGGQGFSISKSDFEFMLGRRRSVERRDAPSEIRRNGNEILVRIYIPLNLSVLERSL